MANLLDIIAPILVSQVRTRGAQPGPVDPIRMAAHPFSRKKPSSASARTKYTPERQVWRPYKAMAPHILYARAIQKEDIDRRIEELRQRGEEEIERFIEQLEQEAIDWVKKELPNLICRRTLLLWTAAIAVIYLTKRIRP